MSQFDKLPLTWQSVGFKKNATNADAWNQAVYENEIQYDRFKEITSNCSWKVENELRAWDNLCKSASNKAKGGE